MTFLELVKKRYSARSYSSKAVEQSKLDYILECARLAPSAVNFQPWHFTVVKSDAQREKLQQCYPRDWFNNAPIYIIVCADEPTAWTRKPDNKNHADIDASIAIEHICLAATEQGLGSCWVCNFDTEIFKSNFDIPTLHHPVAIIPLGYVKKAPETHSQRKDISEIVSTI